MPENENVEIEETLESEIVEDSEQVTETQDETQEEESTITLDGVEYSKEELTSLIEAGKSPSEIHKAATQKFQEASEMRKQYEEVRQFLDMWNQGSDMQAKIIQQLQELHTSDNPNTTVEEPEFYSDTERALWQSNHQLQQKLSQLEKQILPALGEVQQFVKGESQAKQDSKTVAAIKESFGIDVPLTQLVAMRESGISDPLKAIEFFKPWMGKAAEVGAEKAKAKPNTPSGVSGDTFDLNDPKLDGDDVFRLMMKGKRPV